MALDPARQAALQETSARALVAAAFDVDSQALVAVAIPGALTLKATTERGFAVLGSIGSRPGSPDTAAHNAMGAALVWAAHAGVEQLVLLAERDAGVHARRAAVLRSRPLVHQVRGTETGPAVATDLAPLVEIDPAARRVRPVLEAAGLEVVIEHGHMVGEVAGLEVARVVVSDGQARIEVGVGAGDRAASSMLHRDRPMEETLGRVTEEIGRFRRPGAGGHAVGRLCRPRWLRAHLVEHPDLVGVHDLRPVEPPVVREGVRDNVAAPALGVDPADSAVVLVMATVGFDPGLVPLAADLVRRHDVRRVIVARPPRDGHRILDSIVQDLPGGTVRGVSPPWDPQRSETTVD